MRDYEEFLLEKEKIDQLLDKGFFISDVTENLEGAFVLFSDGQETKQLHIQSPNARKYFAFLLKKQNKAAFPSM